MSGFARRASPDLLRAVDAIASRGGKLGAPLHVLDETTSTNDEAKRAAKQDADVAPHGTTFIAESQIAGRGRQGRAWISPRGENLLFSVLMRVTCAPARLPLLALVSGLAVRDAVARAAPSADVRIKWPNDVVIGRGARAKKIAGVLVEATFRGSKIESAIVGVGINVHTRAFDESIEKIATSVALVADAPPDRAEILADVLASIDRDAELVLARGLGLVHARLVAADSLVGVRVAGDEHEGIADGIDLEGRLRVKKDDGTIVRVSAGEVRVVR